MLGWPWGITNEWVVIIKGALLFNAYGMLKVGTVVIIGASVSAPPPVESTAGADPMSR